MPSNPDTLEEAKENFRKRQEGYRRSDDPHNLYKHPRIKRTPRPGSRVLKADREGSSVKDVQAVVLTVSPSDRSCRVRRDGYNRMFLLNRSKLVRDPAYAGNDVNDGACVAGIPVGVVTSPRGSIRRTDVAGSSPVRRVTRRLRFLGQQVVPNTTDDEDEEAGVLPVLPQALPLDPVRDQPA